MSTLKTIQLHIVPSGVDCWFQYEDGAVTSFDPDQLPAKLAEVLGDALGPALAAKAAAEAQAAATQADNDAKDANIQALLADLEAANLAKARAEAKVAELLPLAQLTDPSLTA